MSDRQSTICPDNLYLQARDIHLQLKDVHLQPEDIHLYPKDRLTTGQSENHACTGQTGCQS